MADSDTTQQVTSKTPATKQKNPKRIAAGKAIAERTRQAREAQKKALAEANVIIANNQLKQAEPAPPAADTPPAEPSKNVLTTTQWLSVISIVVSLAGIYYKREEIKGLLIPKKSLSLALHRPLLQTRLLCQEKASNRWTDQLNFIHIDIPCENLTLFRPQSKLPPSAE